MRPEFVLKLCGVAVLVHEPQHPAEDGREAVRQPVDGAEVDHAEPPIGEQAEIARVRVRVQQANPRRTREQETDEHDAGPVPLSGRAVGDDPGERNAVHPFADQHMVADGDHMRYADVRVARVGDGEGLLGGSFPPVIELLGHPVPQLGQQRLGVQPGHERPEKPGEAAQLVEIADQRLAHARVLDLDRNLAPVVPHAPVHLADGGGGRRLVVELGEAGPPVLAHVPREHLVNSPGRQRRRGFLQPGQGIPVRAGDLRRHRGLEYGKCLPELHRAALELAKDPEDLLCRPLLDFLGHHLSWPAAQAPAGSQRGPASEPDRQPSQSGCAGDTMAGQITHDPILRYAGHDASQ